MNRFLATGKYDVSEKRAENDEEQGRDESEDIENIRF